MSRQTDHDIAAFEAEIRDAARKNTTNAMRQKCSCERAERVFRNLGGFAASGEKPSTLHSRIRSQLATERRWARIGHPNYDINRHLALIEAMNHLEDEQQAIHHHKKNRQLLPGDGSI